jgi:hypothetical protein
MAATIQPPNTVTSTSHGVTLHSMPSGRMIGSIFQWSPKQTLAVTEVREFGNVTGPYGSEAGMPYEKVPGNVSGMQIEVGRCDLYTQRLEEAFGTVDLTILSQDPNAFDVREAWRTPSNTNNYALVYQGCRFSSISRSLATTDERIVRVTGTLDYTRVFKIAI